MLRLVTADTDITRPRLPEGVIQSGTKSLNVAQPGPKSLNVAQPGPKSLNVAQPGPKSLNVSQPAPMALTVGQPAPMALTVGQPAPMALTVGQPAPTALTVGQPRQTIYPSADAYKQYDHRTHVYMKPDTYIGADERMVREEWLYDFTEHKMINATIDFVPGCERLYLEVLTNASDNVGRSRRAGVDPGRIDIVMNNSTISITNYGLPIPVEMHPKEGVYVPQMIFGSLLTSSNYEVDRHEAGTNGIGAKAANIFSNEFMVIVHDHIRHLKYTQVWKANMTQKSDPAIEEYSGKESSVQIVYQMDFTRFKYPVPKGESGGYPPEAFALFARHAIDISFTAKTAVSFNGSQFNYANIREYARLYFGDAVENAIVHYQWPEGTEIVNKKKGLQVAKNPAITPEIELIAIDTPDSGHHVSFINCMMTRDGGVHVNAAVKAVGDSAVQMINDTVIKKLVKQNKGKELDAKEKRSHTITINDVKPHISILLSAKVTNPKFTSQTKTMLHSPVPKIDVPEEELRGITRWQLIDRLYAALEAKQFASMAKTDGKLKRYVRLQNGVDANNAGKAQRQQCILYITEGKSGAGYANKLVGLVPGGRDNIGVLPMRGKSLNVMNADRFQIEKNAEINELKKMLGLCEGMEYSDPNNFNKLRYGAIMIMADSDVDGKHIIGLILNFFHCRFPSLLARGFVMYYRTPTLRVTFNRQTLKFYTKREYDEWVLKTPNYQNWKHKYYKGLGTSKDTEISDDFQTPRVVLCFYDDKAAYTMKLHFDKRLADQRKDLIGAWRPVVGIDEVQTQPISWFLNYELILYSIENVRRSIPGLVDGLKESHRKILHGAHKKWNIQSGNPDYTEVKVAQFGAFVAEKSNYHHGELILDDVVVGMAQDFTGANNVPWFCRDGQFGCVDPNTPILIWGGSTKMAKDIKIDDVLVGDDGKPRNISKIVNGTDHMYDVFQEYGDTYRVNSQHILTLHYTKHKSINWDQSNGTWTLQYYDTTEQKIKSFVTSNSDKDQGEVIMLEFANTIPNDDIFDINIQTYLSLQPDEKDLFRSVRLDYEHYKSTIGGKIYVKCVGVGDYVGWYIDGNERFLLGDFTVTHNTRFQGGKDAAETRYSYTRPERLVGYILRKEDRPILKHVIDEGEDVEPETYYPVVPMALVNGVHGIGTGWSSTIPNHEMLDIINWLRLKIQGSDEENLPLILPQYRGFKGIIKVIDRCRQKRGANKVTITTINNSNDSTPQINTIVADDDDAAEDDDNEGLNDEEDEELYLKRDEHGSRPLLSMVSIGNFHQELDGKIVVNELPIGSWPHKYHKWLEVLVEEKKISGFRDMSVDNTVYFEIYGFKDSPNHRTLKLKRTIGMSNMVLLDENGHPVRYDTSSDVLEAFYSRRLPIYQIRKDYIIGNINETIKKLTHKIRFIRAVINKEIHVMNRKKVEIMEAMDALSIPRELLKTTKISECTEDEVIDLTNDIAVKEGELNTILQTTPQSMWLHDLDELERAYRSVYVAKDPQKVMSSSLENATAFPQGLSTSVRKQGRGIKSKTKTPAITPSNHAPPPVSGLRVISIDPTIPKD
jgi:DNA gyrase/topoisomerase IV subunit B